MITEDIPFEPKPPWPETEAPPIETDRRPTEEKKEARPVETRPASELVAPQSIHDIAALKGDEAIRIIETKDMILRRIRALSLRLTSPNDWVLFRTRDGEVYGYVTEAGCQRFRQLWGIEINNVSDPRVEQESDGEFSVTLTGDGYCNLTRLGVTGIIGQRGSREDFVKYEKGTKLQSLVKKAARANLDGNITRELCGLKNVPEAEIKEAWKDTGKTTDRCAKGKGFGTQAEREGAEVQTGPDGVKPPACPKCGTEPMRFRPAGKKKNGDSYSAFWGCFNFPECKGYVRDSDWRRESGQED